MLRIVQRVEEVSGCNMLHHTEGREGGGGSRRAGGKEGGQEGGKGREVGRGGREGERLYQLCPLLWPVCVGAGLERSAGPARVEVHGRQL